VLSTQHCLALLACLYDRFDSSPERSYVQLPADGPPTTNIRNDLNGSYDSAKCENKEYSV